MTEPEKTRYTIKTLLSTAVQPWPNMSEEELTVLTKDIKIRDLTDPIDLSSDGIVFDGTQRLRGLIKLGREYLTAKDIRIWPEVNSDNILEHAIRRNLHRRHLTMEMKIEAARKMRAEFRWTQSKIGLVFGVTQSQVSRWLAVAKEEDDEPVESSFDGETITGADGKEYPAESAGRGRPRNDKLVTMWVPAGPAFKAVKKAADYLERGVEGHEPIGALDKWQLEKLLNLLNDTQESATALAEMVTTMLENPSLVESGSLDLDR